MLLDVVEFMFRIAPKQRFADIRYEIPPRALTERIVLMVPKGLIPRKRASSSRTARRRRVG